MAGAVVAVGEIVTGFLFAAGVSAGAAAAIGQGIIAVGLFAGAYGTYAFLLNTVQRVLVPRQQAQDIGSGLEVTVTDTAADGYAIFGSVRVGGINKIPPITGGDEGRYLEQVLELAMHECDSCPAVTADDDVIGSQLITSVTGTSNDGLVTAGTKFTNHLWVRFYAGTATQTVDFILNNRYPTSFTSDFRGRGRCYAAMTYDWGDGKIYTAVPLMMFHVNGAKVYNARKDSTQTGGSGSHRTNDPTTWEWSCNPADIWATYAMMDIGGDVDPADIDWPSVMAAAGVCDEVVDIPSPYSAYAADGTGSITGDTITKTSGTSTWGEAAVRSTTGVHPSRHPYASAHAPAQISHTVVFGLTTDPTANASYDSIDYAWAIEPLTSQYSVYENGVSIRAIPAPGGDMAKICSVEVIREQVHYFLDGKLCYVRPLASSSADLYFDAAIHDVGDELVIYKQKRYTFNARLRLPVDWRENARLMIDAMVGRMTLRDGKWFIYAGAYTAPSFTVAKTDWLAISSIKTVVPQNQGRWNDVHVWYTDPKRNWQREECFPRKNSTYINDDAGIEIPLELEQPACTNEFEAQRKGEFLLRQSRNQVALVGTLPPRFHHIATGDVGSFTFEELGWSSKVMQVRAMDLNPDGSVNVAIAEHQDTDWTDLTASEYNSPSTSVIPAQNPTKPTAPTALNVNVNLTGVLTFEIGLPVVVPRNTRYQIIRSTVSSNAAVGTVVYDGSDLRTILPAPSSVHYYYTRAYANSYFSAYFPNSNGISALPLGWDTTQINTNAATDILTAYTAPSSSNDGLVGTILGTTLNLPGVPCTGLLTVSALLRRNFSGPVCRVFLFNDVIASENYNILPTSNTLFTFQKEFSINSATGVTSCGIKFDCGTQTVLQWQDVRLKMELVKR